MATKDSIPLGKHTKAGGHSAKKSPEYNSWKMMKSRCYSRNATSYHRYGGRGITVCERWRNSFLDFLADMGPRPTNTTLDRYPDKDGNYEPGNCRWATRKEQQNNTIQTRLLTLNGETMCLKDWAKRIGISQRSVSHRLASGWSVEKALSTPFVPPNKRGVIMLTHDGKTMPLQEWSCMLNVQPNTIYQRINLLGWSVEKALSTPTRRHR